MSHSLDADADNLKSLLESNDQCAAKKLLLEDIAPADWESIVSKVAGPGRSDTLSMEDIKPEQGGFNFIKIFNSQVHELGSSQILLLKNSKPERPEVQGHNVTSTKPCSID